VSLNIEESARMLEPLTDNWIKTSKEINVSPFQKNLLSVYFGVRRLCLHVSKPMLLSERHKRQNNERIVTAGIRQS
jgi:hypothetical protein